MYFVNVGRRRNARSVFYFPAKDKQQGRVLHSWYPYRLSSHMLTVSGHKDRFRNVWEWHKMQCGDPKLRATNGRRRLAIRRNPSKEGAVWRNTRSRVDAVELMDRDDFVATKAHEALMVAVRLE
jgi:hypothetical protein